ncbi:RNA-directed DNA polymerase, partial [Vibrio parahaemolyticus]|nr:RNA-directed DNA polymerase [Vibrio parahaemolyticus]
ASNLADKEEDVALLSLDLKSYFYHVDFDFNLISDFIEQNKDSFADLELAKLLTEALEKVHDTYNYITYKSATLTHPDCQKKFWLPIGMASSAIIANWYLSEFDKDISNKVRPSYYGRYVDDILLVFRRPNFEQQNPIESFIEHYFNNLLKRDKGPKADYFITIDQNKL